MMIFAQQLPVGLDGDAALIATAAAVFAGTLFVLFALYRAFLYICRPHEILIVAGRKQRFSDGSTKDFTVVQSGRVWRTPFFEQVKRMDIRLIPVSLEVKNALSKGNVSLTVHAVANVKVTSNPAFVANAVERFLVASLGQIRNSAQQTLEGALREVVAQLTPEEINEDRLRFAHTLAQHTQDDLEKLGLQLDTLKIQRVDDPSGYLQNLSRVQIAEKLRDAKVFEDQANQIVQQKESEARERVEVEKKTAEIAVNDKKNQLRTLKGQLEGDAVAVEREAQAAMEGARAMAEQELQTVRRELESRRLQAEVVLPAEAQRVAAEHIAIGDASMRRELGLANADVIRLLTEALASAGPQAREMFVLSQLDTLVGKVTERVKGIKMDEVNLVDNGSGTALPALMSGFPAMVSTVLSSVTQLAGVDMKALLRTGQDPESTTELSPAALSSSGAAARLPAATPNRPEVRK